MTGPSTEVVDGIEQPRDPLWYKRAVFYEVLIRGFHDSNGDGTGDLRGLTQKLDYLHWLGPRGVALRKQESRQSRDVVAVHMADQDQVDVFDTPAE